MSDCIKDRVKIDSVTVIEDYAFCNCTNLEDVSIPDSITEMGSDVFYDTPFLSNQRTSVVYAGKWVVGCSKRAKSVEIKYGTVGIADCAFSRPYQSFGYWTERTTEEVYIPDTVTYIGGAAFYECSTIKSVNIPDSVTYVESNAFYGTQILDEQTTAVKYIDKWAVDCDADVKEVTIADGTVGISPGTFSGCKKLESVNVPDSIEHIGWNAFDDTPFYTNQTTDVKYAGNWAIGCEKKADTIAIKDGTIGIACATFSHSYMKTVSIPNSVKIIEYEAFYSCTKLKSVTIPKSVTEIEPEAFGYCFSCETGGHYKSSYLKIKCYSGTAAETYAKGNDIDYELVGCETKITDCKITGIKSKYSYTGKAIKPTVTIKNGSTTLVKGTDYTLSYSSNKKTGKAKVVIKGKGNYTGTVTKYFYIVPKKVSSVKVSSSKTKQIKVKWKKDSTASGYQIVYATNKKFTSGKKTVNISKNSTVAKTIKSLKKGKTYYVKVRAYKTINGNKYYGSCSTVKKIKCK